jgi:hypothetical protein
MHISHCFFIDAGIETRYINIKQGMDSLLHVLLTSPTTTRVSHEMNASCDTSCQLQNAVFYKLADVKCYRDVLVGVNSPKS